MALTPEEQDEVREITEENMEAIRELFGERLTLLEESKKEDNLEFEVMRENYLTYNATATVPIKPNGTRIIMDLRGTSSSGTIAEWVSVGDKWVEAWAKVI